MNYAQASNNVITNCFLCELYAFARENDFPQRRKVRKGIITKSILKIEIKFLFIIAKILILTRFFLF